MTRLSLSEAISANRLDEFIRRRSGYSRRNREDNEGDCYVLAGAERAIAIGEEGLHGHALRKV